MLLAEFMLVIEEYNAERAGGGGEVGARVGEQVMTLGSEGAGKELPEVAEANNSDFELGAAVEELQRLRLDIHHRVNDPGLDGHGGTANRDGDCTIEDVAVHM